MERATFFLASLSTASSKKPCNRKREFLEYSLGVQTISVSLRQLPTKTSHFPLRVFWESQIGPVTVEFPSFCPSGRVCNQLLVCFPEHPYMATGIACVGKGIYIFCPETSCQSYLSAAKTSWQSNHTRFLKPVVESHNLCDHCHSFRKSFSDGLWL